MSCVELALARPQRSEHSRLLLNLAHMWLTLARDAEQAESMVEPPGLSPSPP